MELTLQIPRKMRPFLDPARYKGAKGGRGSGKSHNVARILLLRGLSERQRILCAREIQKSIKDSVHKLFADLIEKMGLGSAYEVQRDVIKGPHGTEFLFIGLQDHTADSIKSYEGVDICWIEEAHTVSQRSWEILVPTIRKPGSEIWATWNPESPEDAVESIFVHHPQPGTVLVEMNWRDNPWFPEELEAERVHLQRLNPDLYAHVWEGQYRTAAGLMFKRDWMRFYERKPAELAIYMASDYAVTEDGGDWTEHGVFGLDHAGNLYALDWWSGQTSPETWIEAALRLAKLWRPRMWFDEAGVIRRAVDGAINKRMRELQIFVSRESLPSASNKAARALGIAARFSAGAVYLPSAPEWSTRLVNQLCGFNGEDGRVDDMVDVCSLIGRGLDEMADGAAPSPPRPDPPKPFTDAYWAAIDKTGAESEAAKQRYYR